MGIDFTMMPGKGPKILRPIATQHDVSQLHALADVGNQVPFLRPILQVRPSLLTVVLSLFGRGH
jgi:hypothetical protein